MKKIQKIIAGAIMATMLMAPAGTVLADETEDTCGGIEDETDATSETTQELSFDTLYGSQIGSFLYHQYTFEGEEIPVYETNFYFINAFIELSQYAYYGQAPATSEGYIDLSEEFGGDYPTFGDYFVAYAENTIESTMIICKRAEDEGVTLTEETQTAIDDMIADLATESAAPQGMTIDEYLALYFGEGMDEAAFRKTLEDYYLADAYSQKYCENYEFADEDKYVPNIRYALFYAPNGSSEDTLAQAQTAANDLLAQCSDIDDMQVKAQELLADGTVFETNDILVPMGVMVPSFEAWAYEDHEVGDMDVILSEEYGYFVVGYLGKEEKSQDELDALALTALSEEISNEIDTGKYQFGTDQAYEPAIPVAAEGDVYDPAAGELMLNITTTPTPSAEMAPGGDDTSNTIIWVLAIIGGVAVVGVIVILIVSVVGKKDDKITGKAKKEKAGKEEPADTDTEPEETDGDEE